MWSYDPQAAELTCRYQAPSADVLELPTTSPPRATAARSSSARTAPATNYIRGLTRDAELFDIALNRLHRNGSRDRRAARYNEEFAGATFGPGTDTLFVNIQASAGITFAIWGPWGRLGV